jgi:hypothetical protein
MLGIASETLFRRMEDNFDWKNTTDANALQIDATRKTFNCN